MKLEKYFKITTTKEIWELWKFYNWDFFL